PNIVYSARGDEVTDVVINGAMVVEDRVVMTMDEEKVITDAQKAAEEIAYNAVDDYMTADSVLAKAVRKGLI
ncbi:MAG: amidohydrolase, partial [Anaerolineae bacterium]|nr:amidohydrolase [Anaerolineae bacterium]